MSNAKPDAKPANAAATKGGRPLVGNRPMTSAERSKRSRLRRRQARQVKPLAVLMADVTSESVLHDLIAERRITTSFHRTIALKIVNALANDKLALAEKLLNHLPAVCGEVSASPTDSAGFDDKLWAGIASAFAATRAERGELSELEQLRLENAQLKQRLDGLPVTPPVGTGALAANAPTTAAPITPSLGDIVPPSEIGVCKPTYPDDGRYKPGASKPVLDLKPEPVKPEPPPQPAPTAPARTPSWDSSPNAAAWREWRDSGGLDSGSMPFTGNRFRSTY
jgi:hypothetical protein